MVFVLPVAISDLKKEAIATRLIWTWTDVGGFLSAARRAHLEEVENGLMDTLLQ